MSVIPRLAMSVIPRFAMSVIPRLAMSVIPRLDRGIQVWPRVFNPFISLHSILQRLIDFGVSTTAIRDTWHASAAVMAGSGDKLWILGTLLGKVRFFSNHSPLEC
jgi:hypothetical protein